MTVNRHCSTWFTTTVRVQQKVHSLDKGKVLKKKIKTVITLKLK